MIASYVRSMTKALASESLTGLQVPRTALDMVWCTIIYGSSPNNYSGFGWRGTSHKWRRSFVTYRENQRLINGCNRTRAIACLEDKAAFAVHFKSFLGRQVLDLRRASLEDALEFVARGNGVLVKPRSEGQGRGVRVLTAAELGDRGLEAALLGLRGGDWLLEDLLIQHDAISNSYGHALAPARLVTLRSGGRPHVIWASITLPTSKCGPSVNPHTGGLVTAVDSTTGTCSPYAVGKDGTSYITHPESGTSFDGFSIPFWNEAVAMVKSASDHLPDAGFVGWDVGITPQGPALIEGNSDPGTYVSLQKPVFSKARGGGLKPLLAGLT